MMLNQWSTMLKPSICHWVIYSQLVFCLSVPCLSSIHPAVVNQSLELSSAADAVLLDPGVRGLTPFKACLPASEQTDTANQAPSMREQLPHRNNLLFKLSNPQPQKKRLQSLLASPQDKLTRLEGSVHGLCVLVEARNRQPSRKWRED